MDFGQGPALDPELITQMQRTAVQAAEKRLSREHRMRVRRGSLPLSLKARREELERAAAETRRAAGVGVVGVAGRAVGGRQSAGGDGLRALRRGSGVTSAARRGSQGHVVSLSLAEQEEAGGGVVHGVTSDEMSGVTSGWGEDEGQHGLDRTNAGGGGGRNTDAWLVKSSMSSTVHAPGRDGAGGDDLHTESVDEAGRMSPEAGLRAASRGSLGLARPSAGASQAAAASGARGRRGSLPMTRVE